MKHVDGDELQEDEMIEAELPFWTYPKRVG